MPYLFVDELPEGAEEADVVSHADYDAIAEELAGVTAQRDEAMEQIAEARREAKDARGKYASLMLEMGKHPQREDNGNQPKATTIDSLFE